MLNDHQAKTTGVHGIADPTAFELLANKGQANGYAPLSAIARLHMANMPTGGVVQIVSASMTPTVTSGNPTGHYAFGGSTIYTPFFTAIPLYKQLTTTRLVIWASLSGYMGTTQPPVPAFGAFGGVNLGFSEGVPGTTSLNRAGGYVVAAVPCARLYFNMTGVHQTLTGMCELPAGLLFNNTTPLQIVPSVQPDSGVAAFNVDNQDTLKVMIFEVTAAFDGSYNTNLA